MVNRRNVGHAYERQIMHEMIDLGFTKCKTSRNESRILDAQGSDLTGLPFHVQCKRWIHAPNYHGVLNGMLRDKIRLLFHKIPHKGEVVVMDKEDFYKMIKHIIDIEASYGMNEFMMEL